MKLTFLFLLLAALPLAAGDGQLTDSERTVLINHLEMSKKNMLESIAGLTPAQWSFKAAPDKWSVAECAEHIILAEGYLMGATQKILQSPTVARPEKSNAEVDQKLLAGITDRSHKLTAPEPLVPSHPPATPEEAALLFSEARDKTIAYAKTTPDDLRVHVADSPAGKIDAYQFLLLLSAHSARHTAQIKEVEANADFPKAAAGTN